ncbi:MAG: hypothetical protein ACI8RD_006783 [Bacillariaceae sp.]|jgi:hypothetical protein
MSGNQKQLRGENLMTTSGGEHDTSTSTGLLVAGKK